MACAQGVRATFDKRYITLAPVAGVVGIGFELRDPEGLLGGDGGEGFTVALLERGHAGTSAVHGSANNNAESERLPRREGRHHLTRKL